MSFHAPIAGDGMAGAGPALNDAEFRAIAEILHREARITLPPHKATLVRSRLSRRLRERGLRNFGDYIALVKREAAELKTMVDALTTNHTHFFREQHHIDHLVSEMLPQWRARTSRDPVRIWSCASSSGEEVYSVAMALLGRDRISAQWAKSGAVELFASDISSAMVAALRRAEYGAGSASQIPEPYRTLWTTPTPTGFRIAAEARELVTAAELNLFGRWPMRHRFDAIFCRNVMIYFADDAKAELEMRLVEQLVPGGALYIGHSERLTGSARAPMIPCGHTMYRKAETGR